ncbi:MAG: hypothetical protein LC122_13160 [Chitinophagales bacterium]|nr:hypothetical protein [Chitinophagales bacterium]
MDGNFSSAANTRSTLGYLDGKNKTSTSLSTNIIILVNDVPVGAIKELSIKERREVKMIDELGTDGHIDSVPTKSTDVSGTCQRLRFDALRITEAFGRSFLHLASQVYPFDIVVLDRNRRAGNKISTVIKNVWFTDLDTRLSADDWLIQDNVSFVAETIYSVLTSSKAGSLVGNSAATGRDLGLITSGPFNTEDAVDIERVVDTGSGGRRGSLDSGGLLDIVDFSSNVF